uniref:THAP-type domain-containing protein n=1 Tax=Photinus pyralis TaxID=7054 RepID=A0A1Y1NJG2_PHOPY
MRCSVVECTTANGSKQFSSNLMFFRFPNDQNIQKRWVLACNRPGHINVKTARVCSKHFDESSYERNLRFELLGYTARNRRLLKPDAVPFLNLPLENSKDVKGESARTSRINKRNRSKLVETLLQTR